MSADGSPPEAATEQTPRSGVLMALSNEMVRLFKEQFGRGPTSARTTWSGDVITVLLENTLTPAERNLVKMGEHERLREMRLFFQYASVREFCEPVERITGRKVRAFTSAIDTHIDGLSVETFVLHPIDASDARSRIEFAEPDEHQAGSDAGADLSRERDNDGRSRTPKVAPD